MAVVVDSSCSSFDVGKLTSEIFSILENNFLFGTPTTKNHIPVLQHHHPHPHHSTPHHHHVFVNNNNIVNNSKVRILSIDGGGSTHGLLAAKSLSRLESCLRRISHNPNASIADYFDVVAGSGTGGILAALLFTRGNDGRPLFTADEALSFLLQNRRKLDLEPSPRGWFLRRAFRPPPGKALEKLLGKTFGECTLKDTLKSVLIPCYDVATHGPFVFSRADALEMDGYDFKMSDVCLATSADRAAADIRSVDSRTKVMAVDGRIIAMNNPTAVAITHVLNNKQEFPLCNGVEDLLVLSLGNGGASDFGFDHNPNPSPAHFLRLAGEGASDVVDQAVAMAFGQCGANNYVRVQSNGIIAKESNNNQNKVMKKTRDDMLVGMAQEVLSQRYMESFLFKGKKISESTNLDKLETMGGELIKEEERRKTSILPAVVLKQMSAQSPPRTSSATSLSTLSSSSC